MWRLWRGSRVDPSARPRERGDPEPGKRKNWIPAYAGMSGRGLPPIDPAATPAALPHLLADGAGDARRVRGRRDRARLAAILRDVEHQLGADRVLELVALTDRNHERAGPADDAVLVIDVEILQIDRARLRLLQHDRQAVDHDALGEHVVAH